MLENTDMKISELRHFSRNETFWKYFYPLIYLQGRAVWTIKKGSFSYKHQKAFVGLWIWYCLCRCTLFSCNIGGTNYTKLFVKPPDILSSKITCSLQQFKFWTFHVAFDSSWHCIKLLPFVYILHFCLFMLQYTEWQQYLDN